MREYRCDHDPAAVRFWSKVAAGDPRECWLWLGAQKKGGYGHLHLGPRNGGRYTGAHRYAYELLRGPIPEGMVIDHLCRVHLCVNPLHLEPVTTHENLRRGEGHGRETHCPQGHAYDEQNTYVDSKNRRRCRACNRDARRSRAAIGPERWRK